MFLCRKGKRCLTEAQIRELDKLVEATKSKHRQERNDYIKAKLFDRTKENDPSLSGYFVYRYGLEMFTEETLNKMEQEIRERSQQFI